MNFDRLREQILERAIQGKLVPQLESEPEVARFKEVLRDIPFTIPKKWKWTTLKNLVTLISGRDLEKSRILEKETGVPYITGASQIQGENIIVNRWTRTASVSSESGDVLLTCKGTVGKVAINNVGKIHIARQIMALRTNDKIENRYLKFYMMSMAKGLNNNAKSMIPGIDRKTVLEMTIPVPPLLEQYRIVAKLNQIFDQISRAEEAYNELTGPLFERFRQLCLQKAIQGKLVPQLESEPEVSQVGKMPEDALFNIPSKWKWMSLGNVLIQISDGSHNPPPNSGQGIPVLSAKNINNGIIDTQAITRWTTQEQWLVEDKKIHIESGDVLLTIIGSIGRTAVVPDNAPKFMLQRSVCIMRTKVFLCSEFLALILTSPALLEWMTNRASGTAQKGIYLKKLKTMPLPIPPLPEQLRIVKKLKEIFSIMPLQHFVD